MKPTGQISPWGYGSVRNLTPSNLGGPFGSPNQSLPVNSNSAYYGYPGYAGSGVFMKTNKRACSFGMSRSMTPGGVTTEKGWGYKKFGKRKSRKTIKRRKSRKTIKRRKSRKAIKRRKSRKTIKKRKSRKTRKSKG